MLNNLMGTLFNWLTDRRLIVAVIALALMLGGAFQTAAASTDFDLKVYHGINGNSLGLSKELPVRADIYLDGAPLASVDLVFGDVVRTKLPAGNYEIQVYSYELDAFIPSMAVGPADIPAGVSVDLQAKLSGEKTPDIKVKIK